MQIACSNGNFRISQALLEHGANANEIDEFGETALHVAARHNFISIAKLLLQYKASPSHEIIHTGDTPLHVACIHGSVDVAMLLVDLSTNIHRPNVTHIDRNDTSKSNEHFVAHISTTHASRNC